MDLNKIYKEIDSILDKLNFDELWKGFKKNIILHYMMMKKYILEIAKYQWTIDFREYYHRQ